MVGFFFFFKQKTAYEITYGDWSSDVCSSDLDARAEQRAEVHFLDVLDRQAAAGEELLARADGQHLEGGVATSVGGAGLLDELEIFFGEAERAGALELHPGRQLEGQHARFEVRLESRLRNEILQGENALLEQLDGNDRGQAHVRGGDGAIADVFRLHIDGVLVAGGKVRLREAAGDEFFQPPARRFRADGPVTVGDKAGIKAELVGRFRQIIQFLAQEKALAAGKNDDLDSFDLGGFVDIAKEIGQRDVVLHLRRAGKAAVITGGSTPVG